MSIEHFLTEEELDTRKRLLIAGNIKQLMVNYPVHLFDYGIMLAEAEDNVERAKQNIDNLERSMLKNLRTKYLLERKRITEAQLVERVRSHTDYTTAHEHYLDAKKLFNRVKASYVAMQSHGKMLRSLAKLQKPAQHS